MTTTKAAGQNAKAALGAPTAEAVGHPNLAAALSAFQAEMPVVAKGQTATIPGRDGRAGYSYKYADLADVTEAAMPVLTRHGLAFSCLPRQAGNGSYELAARLLHTSGEHLEAALPIAGRQAQEIGSSLTYGRRYLFGCMTGVVTDVDDDGSLAQAARERTQVEPPPPPPLTPAQEVLSGALGGLGQAEADRLRAWWASEGLPPVAHLSDDQVQKVLGQVQAEAQPDPS